MIWKQLFDADAQEYYFHCASTGDFSWERPTHGISICVYVHLVPAIPAGFTENMAKATHACFAILLAISPGRRRQDTYFIQ